MNEEPQKDPFGRSFTRRFADNIFLLYPKKQ